MKPTSSKPGPSAIPEAVRAHLPTPIPLAEWAPEAGSGLVREGAQRESADHGVAPEESVPTVSRRVALKVLATAAAVPTVACEASPETGGSDDILQVTQPPSNPHAAGTLADPDLLNAAVPWELKLTDSEMTTVGSLADLIIPADGRSPSATAVGAHLYINEYVSAPYDAQMEDLVLIRGGLVWLTQESQRRFELPFHDLSAAQQKEICDPIRHLPDAPADRRAQARFFDKFRDLISTGFWTTDEGMADLGYQGNVASLEFSGPPPEVLERLGLT